MGRWVDDVAGGQWGALRGLVIALVLLAHCTQAIPVPSMPDEEDVAAGDWRASDLELWHGWTTRVVPIDKATFDQVLLSYFTAVAQLGRTVRAPALPVFKFAKINQQWGLFARVTTAPDALAIEIRENGTWRLVEQRLHPTAGWHDEQFRYRRLRGIWDLRKEPAGHYKNFTKWVARMAFAEFPEADRVKIYLVNRQVPSPWEPEDPEREIKYLRSHKRENHAP